MNTGIGDAINLGRKLAQVLQGRAAPALLDSYEPERIGFARTLASTTDHALTPMAAEGIRGEFARRVVAPLFMTAATRFALSRHTIFRVVSQIRIHYSERPLSEDKAGEVEGGDRLPWVRAGAEDNFAALRSLDWQVHVYGAIEQGLEAACADLRLQLHIFPWTSEAERAGLKRDAVYVVRPDGYVAFASPEQDVTKLRAFIDRFHLRFSLNTPGGT